MNEEEYSLSDLILLGAVEVSGVGSDGEFLYNFTEDAPKIVPEMFNYNLNRLQREVMYFWELGFIELDNITSFNPVVMLTPLAFDENAIEQLPQEKQMMLEEIKRGLEREIDDF